ncbi:MAG: FecR domain-containing protein [Myxococcales bacterium]|nr:FecR domain-containing protein [Myxococcales bacterium]
MSDHGRPPVEPLPDLTWARVERDLWAALDRPGSSVAAGARGRSAPRLRLAPRLVRGLAVGALVAAAAIAVIAVWPAGPTGGGGLRASDLPSRVATAAAPTTVSFGDAEITIAAQSTLVLAGTPAHGVDIVLEQGSATFAVAPRRGRPPFHVHAGAVDIRVVGTRFTVTRSGDAARVDVAHGEVEVVAHGRRELLLAGSSWDSSRDWEAAIRSSATITNPDDIAAAQPLAAELPGAELPGAELPGAGAIAAPPVAPPDGRAPLPDSRAAYEAAAALERSDPAAALAAYRRLARGRGPWAANALYAAALLAEQRGDAALALTLARQYGQRFPRGANAADAARLVTRLEGAPHAPTP